MQKHYAPTHDTALELESLSYHSEDCETSESRRLRGSIVASVQSNEHIEGGMAHTKEMSWYLQSAATRQVQAPCVALSRSARHHGSTSLSQELSGSGQD
ncbi:hypothetical protein PsYK624_097080 [Phanerochaete sordida]|uniref:Uncharacterized protein n=1 Tax=Phanerochaete sordida TaxID=48140 RepID=A0A9P3LGE1_9APHY|nr:hypothetical protein PsYK624_097080 [Phanerochaete sordida]